MTTQAVGPGRPRARAAALARGRRALAFDLLVAAAATVAELSLLLDDDHTARVSTVLLAAASGGALLARRRAPWIVLAAVAGLAGALVGTGDSPGGVPVLVALFTIAERDEWRRSLAALVPVAVFLAALSIVSVPVTAGVWALGAYAQTRRRYVRALEERAEHLERERAQLVRIAAHEERASIARELHDIVAHSVTVMLLGVRGARDVLRTSPDRADDTLAQVERSGEQSVAELRRMLTVLRAPGTPADSRPAPSLRDLDGLVAEYRAAGLPVELRVTGKRTTLPGGLELSAYRIVEEALTNAVRHACPSRVTVELAYHDRRLDLEVLDDGTASRSARAPAAGDTPGDPPGGGTVTGHGLIGMRERAAVLGGELDVGPRPGGGFRVAARLPLGDDA
ncbi:sensor histidine kinase [Frankia sp. CNm7]|uniref:histidine kinase n=1 Tax=Frankia nepalensis TaxID=1836974 RepID=A0A937RU70_9ACTN|nr:sensor histidine kinase [Frankia nepalensis]MBL7502664.1 sensor histidine kinase [Frankia nepalensis]MBL7514928.1 sensor histidine kinase [Frankia nepalensis]MBL7522081.1 sensor histidine kinase [Frankia nepalensis]MBL7632888.1 sensor histidine kinase [Frankia nepalensis]